MSAQKFNHAKVKALDEVYHSVLPRWYTWLVSKSNRLVRRLLVKLVTVNIQYVSMNKEIVKIYFLGRFKDEITFIYY